MARSVAYRAIRHLVRQLPDHTRQKLGVFYHHQRTAWRSLAGHLTLPGVPAASPPSGQAQSLANPAEDCAFAREAAPGDTLLVLGSPWFTGHAATIGRVKRLKGMRLALLIYDVIPLRRPEWCDAGLTTQFRAWFECILPLVDVLLTISQATARDVVHCWPGSVSTDTIPVPVPIPMGSGFGALASHSPRTAHDQHSSLPRDGYVLSVATIEVRKNHILLFRVWRRLLDTLPADQVPTLVLAGKVGWLVEDFMAQLQRSSYLGGKIVLIEEPTDNDLVALYDGCLFTVFPSLYEGWGLPVTESLAAGRPCIASEATSLPEAGGAFARYFDPENVAQAYEMIRDTITDRPALDAWRARVKREFVPVGWDQSARAVLAAIGRDV